MILLHVISSMDPTQGGVCQAVRTMIRGLVETGTCHNEVVTLDAADAGFLAAEPFQVHALGPAKTSWAYAAQLHPWLLENLPRFDSIIVHGLWQYPAYAVRKALNTLQSSHLPASRIPRCYVMPHGMLDPYFQQASSRRIKAIRNTIYWKLIERKGVNEADGLLFTCEEEKLLARKPFRPYRPKSERVVGLGVEEPPVYTAEMRTAFAAACPDLGDQPYLLFLSRIHPKKGVDLLIRAYADLAKVVESQRSKVGETSSTPHSPSSSPAHPSPITDHFPSSSTDHCSLITDHSLPSSTDHCSLITDHSLPFPSLVIAGPLDSAYAEEMQKLAAELLPSSQTTDNRPLDAPRIRFVGMLSGDAKWGAFHGCDAFILPSHQENFGIAVVEALACGKPVLISKQVNIWREIVAAGAGLAEDDTLEGTRRLLEQWLQRSARKLRPNHARECFESLYAIDKSALQLKTAIKSCH